MPSSHLARRSTDATQVVRHCLPGSAVPTSSQQSSHCCRLHRLQPNTSRPSDAASERPSRPSCLRTHMCRSAANHLKPRFAERTDASVPYSAPRGAGQPTQSTLLHPSVCMRFISYRAVFCGTHWPAPRPRGESVSLFYSFHERNHSHGCANAIRAGDLEPAVVRLSSRPRPGRKRRRKVGGRPALVPPTHAHALKFLTNGFIVVRYYPNTIAAVGYGSGGRWYPQAPK